MIQFFSKIQFFRLQKVNSQIFKKNENFNLNKRIFEESFINKNVEIVDNND